VAFLNMLAPVFAGAIGRNALEKTPRPGREDKPGEIRWHCFGALPVTRL